MTRLVRGVGTGVSLCFGGPPRALKEGLGGVLGDFLGYPLMMKKTVTLLTER